MKKIPEGRAPLRPETRLVAAGREYAEHGMVNPAVYRASTILFPTIEAIKEYKQTYTYARRGTPSSRSIESAIAELEGGYRAKMAPSGLMAATSVFLTFLKPGDHLLMVDTVYFPVRNVCDQLLKRFGIETTFYDAHVGAGIAELMRPNTRMVYLESPGSQTMEMQDVPAIAAAAKANGAIVAIDNTWSAGHFFKPLAKGCDISIQAATKYIVGHSDAMLGVVTTTEELWETYRQTYEGIGLFAGPDDNYLALRGLHTLAVRLDRHMANALIVAEWLRERPEVEAVLYPALPGAPGHDLWRRDFTGASGLFSVVLKPASREALARMVDDLSLFGMGFSWGGFESLVVPFTPHRSVNHFKYEGPALRFHIGLENPADLIADLEDGFARLNAAR
ncbi:MAG: cystathionine beta-lyase [Hyphomicrobiales bacterium]